MKYQQVVYYFEILGMDFDEFVPVVLTLEQLDTLGFDLKIVGQQGDQGFVGLAVHRRGRQLNLQLAGPEGNDLVAGSAGDYFDSVFHGFFD